jgi:hypothetical protein
MKCRYPASFTDTSWESNSATGLFRKARQAAAIKLLSVRCHWGFGASVQKSQPFQVEQDLWNNSIQSLLFYSWCPSRLSDLLKDKYLVSNRKMTPITPSHTFSTQINFFPIFPPLSCDMCLCMCIYIHAQVHIHASTYAHAAHYMRKCVGMDTHGCMHALFIHTRVHEHICTRTHTHTLPWCLSLHMHPY